MKLRLATSDDFEAITGIYNHYVATSTTTYDDEPVTAEERRKAFALRGPAHPLVVVEIDGQIVGYGGLGPFRERNGYRFTVENSVYVHPDRHRQGIGGMILADQVTRARALGHHAIIAVIDAGQAASIALHAKHGFVEVGRLPQIGRKFERWLDVVFMERVLDARR
jgi:phosphinothricin acetyltransferase